MQRVFTFRASGTEAFSFGRLVLLHAAVSRSAPAAQSKPSKGNLILYSNFICLQNILQCYCYHFSVTTQEQFCCDATQAAVAIPLHLFFKWTCRKEKTE
jgi:hypothetical protein